MGRAKHEAVFNHPAAKPAARPHAGDFDAPDPPNADEAEHHQGPSSAYKESLDEGLTADGFGDA